MTRVALRLLGPPRVELDGEPVHIGRRKALALLAYLALTRRSHRRDTLAALLWPTFDESGARRGLRNSLSELGRALGRERLAADRQTVGLDLDSDVRLDVEEFRRLVRESERHAHEPGGVCDECTARLERAEALYAGDFLSGFTLQDSPGFDEWQLFETEGLRDELSSVLGQLARSESAAGAHEVAIQHARRRVSLDPLHEPAQRALIEAYEQAGRRSAALRQYREYARTLESELGVPPSSGLTDLFERLCGEAACARPLAILPDAQRRHGLPEHPIPLVGRERETVEVVACLDDPVCRLLTLVGPGGSGKTRLAIEVASTRMAAFDHGVCFVSMAPLESEAEIVPAVTQALGLALSERGDPHRRLLDYLSRRQILIILDSLEHLLAPSERSEGDGAQLIIDIVEAAPQVKVLVTSRMPLRVQYEQRYPVAGMAYPLDETGWLSGDRAGEASDFPAVQLFVQSARRVSPGFKLDRSNTAGVVEACRRVAGMPLGILLASAWVNVLAPEEIARELAQGLDVLESDMQDVPVRQHSMRAVFDHTWRLLSSRQQAIMERLSVFRGGFTPESAGAVTGASLADLRLLVDRSLVQSSGGGRFGMHELLRQYAAERLATDPAAYEDAGELHCTYFVSALERWEIELGGARQLTALSEMEGEISNVRAAWRWAAARARADLLGRSLGGLSRYCTWLAHCRELEADCELAAASLQEVLSDSPEGQRPPDISPAHLTEGLPVLAMLLRWQGAAAHATGKKELGRQLLRGSAEVLERPELCATDTRRERASILLEIASQTRDIDLKESLRLTAQSQAIYQSIDAPWWNAYAVMQVGLALWLSDGSVEAQETLEQSLALFQELGDRREIAWTNTHLGMIAANQGRLDEAERLIRMSLVNHTEIRDPLFYAYEVLLLAGVLLRSGDFEGGHTLIEQARPDIESVGDPTYRAAMTHGSACADLHMGHWARAEQQARASMELSREADVPTTMADAGWILAGTALVAAGQAHEDDPLLDTPPAGEALRKYADAQRLAREGLSTLQELRLRSKSARLLAVLGVVELRLGNLGEARRHTREALSISHDTEFLDPVLSALPAAALVLSHEGEGLRALELYSAASRYPYVGNSQWFRTVFGNPIAQAAASLPPDVVAAAKERGRARDVSATLEELIAEWG